MRDVASLSGVSVATASLVLNGKGSISQEVRRRVLESADSLGYLKNVHAAATASRKSSHVAILVDESYEKAFEWNLVRSILIPLEATITEQHYYPMLIPVTRTQSVQQITDKVVLSGAGALFSIHFGDRNLFTLLEDREIPVIILNHDRGAHQFYSVTDDFIYGTFQATCHLLSRGHRRIVYVDYERPDLPGVVYDRNAGFDKAVSECGASVQHWRITVPDIDSNAAIEDAAQSIDHLGGSEPLAITAHDDYLAAKLYAVLRKRGISIPEQLSIVSPGDTMDYSLPFVPQITTYRTDFELMGTLAGQMLLRRLTEESRAVEALKVQHVLMERGSTRDIRLGAESSPTCF